MVELPGLDATSTCEYVQIVCVDLNIENGEDNSNDDNTMAEAECAR
jgi:hypothetical protein